jgi:preprotein translocase subunit SecA
VDYLTSMEALRTSIGLEAYGQRDPLVQYKSQAFDMFGQLLASIRAGVVSRLFTMRVAGRPQAPPTSQPRQPRGQVPGDDKPVTMKKKRRKKRKRQR